jgi:hypothetical protein
LALWPTPFEIRGVANGNGPARCCGSLSLSLCTSYSRGILPSSRRLSPVCALSTLGHDGRGLRPSADPGALLPVPRMATNLPLSGKSLDLLPPNVLAGRLARSSCSAGITVLPPFLGGTADSSLRMSSLSLGCRNFGGASSPPWLRLPPATRENLHQMPSRLPAQALGCAPDLHARKTPPRLEKRTVGSRVHSPRVLPHRANS